MRSTTRAAMLVLAALLVAHCGGTDDSEAASTQPTVETTSTTSAPTTTTSPPTTTTTSPPTTTTAEPTTTTSAAPEGSPDDDVAVVEALVAAWYGNDFETVSQLLDPLWSPASEVTWTLDDVRRQVEYASALESRVESFLCYPPGQRGQSFWCEYTVGTLVTDAMGWPGGGNATRMEEVVVLDGRVVNWVHDNFGYPNEGVADYLAETEQAEAMAAWMDAGCGNAGPMIDGADCVEMLLRHLDDYVEWFAENG